MNRPETPGQAPRHGAAHQQLVRGAGGGESDVRRYAAYMAYGQKSAVLTTLASYQADPVRSRRGRRAAASTAYWSGLVLTRPLHGQDFGQEPLA